MYYFETKMKAYFSMQHIDQSHSLLNTANRNRSRGEADVSVDSRKHSRESEVKVNCVCRYQLCTLFEAVYVASIL